MYKFIIEEILIKYIDNSKANSNSIISVLPSFITPVILNGDYRNKFNVIYYLIKICLTTNKISSILTDYSTDLFRFFINIIQFFPLLLESELKELFKKENPNIDIEDYISTNLNSTNTSNTNEELVLKSQYLNLLMFFESCTTEIFTKLLKILNSFQPNAVRQSKNFEFNIAILTLRPIIGNSSNKFIQKLLLIYLSSIEDDLSESNFRIYYNLNKWFCLRDQIIAPRKILDLCIKHVLIQEIDLVKSLQKFSIVEIIQSLNDEPKYDLSKCRIAGLRDENLNFYISIIKSVLIYSNPEIIIEYTDRLKTLILKFLECGEKSKYKLAGKLFSGMIEGLVKFKISDISPLSIDDYSNSEIILNFYQKVGKYTKENIKPNWILPTIHSIKEAKKLVHNFVYSITNKISENIPKFEEAKDYSLVNKWLILFNSIEYYCIFSTAKRKGLLFSVFRKFLENLWEGDNSLIENMLNAKEEAISYLICLINNMKKVGIYDETTKSISTNFIKAIYKILKNVKLEDLKTQIYFKWPLINDINRNYPVYRDMVGFNFSTILSVIGMHRSQNTIDLFILLIDLINGVENNESMGYLRKIMNHKYHICHSNSRFKEVSLKISEMLYNYITIISSKQNKELIEFENAKINMIRYLRKLNEISFELDYEYFSNNIEDYEKLNQLFKINKKTLEYSVMILIKSVQELFAMNFFNYIDYEIKQMDLTDEKEFLSKLKSNKENSESIMKHLKHKENNEKMLFSKMMDYYSYLTSIDISRYNFNQELLFISLIYAIASRSDITTENRFLGLKILLKLMNNENILTHLTAEAMITKLLKIQIHLSSENKYIKIPEEQLSKHNLNSSSEYFEYPKIIQDELQKGKYKICQPCDEKMFELVTPNVFKLYTSTKMELNKEIGPNIIEIKEIIANEKFIKEYLHRVSDCINLAFEQSLNNEEHKAGSKINSFLNRVGRSKNATFSLEGFSQEVHLSLNIK